MQQIKGLSAIPSQKFRVPIDEGVITFTLTFRPAAQMWFVDIEFDTFVARGLRVVQSLNMLIQYEEIIPFGLLVDCTDDGDPFLINDFSSERITMNVLSSIEIGIIELGLANA